jgi:hypothetical protein
MQVVVQEEDDDTTLSAVQTLDSLNRNYNRRMDPYEIVGISVYRELQRRRTLLSLENRLTAEIIVDILSERILNGTLAIMNTYRHAMESGAAEGEDYSAYDELGEILFNIPTVEPVLPPTKTLDGEVNIDCSICLTPVEPAAVIFDLPCNHVFHEGCLKTWLEKKSTCPLCRKEIKD